MWTTGFWSSARTAASVTRSSACRTCAAGRTERDLTLVLDNRACRFDPHVQVAEVGQWLEIRNSDPILHNADARIGQETLFNVALPPARQCVTDRPARGSSPSPATSGTPG